MRSVDDERDYLENLLNTRFNYYLVFSSLVLLTGFNEDVDPAARPLIFGIGFIVSMLMAYAVARTWRLLQILLNDILASDDHSGHPYRTAYEGAEGFPLGLNANYAILGIVFALTGVFFAGLLRSIG